MGKKQAYDYFDTLYDLAKVLIKENRYLIKTISEFQCHIGQVECEEVHLIKQECIEKRQEMIKHLQNEFITPLDREDIVVIADKIKEVIINLEDVILKLYMFHVSKLRGEIKELSEILLSCNESLKVVIKEFHHFKKPNKLSVLIKEVHNIETQGNSLYIKAMKRLYENNHGGSSNIAIEIYIWTEILKQFNHCFNSIRCVVDKIEMIIIKNY